LILNGIPRTGLSVKEVATITGHKIDRIRRAVRNGEIRADRTGQTAVIPVTELAEIAKWADYKHGP
jgi:excisionase family DNA binding protein